MAEKNSFKLFTFKVAEAQSKDVGRAIARIDPYYYTKLQVATGDIVKIENPFSLKTKLNGKSNARNPFTVAKIMPLFPEDRGKGVVQIDGITRENIKTSIDEKVAVQKVPYQQANALVLAPINSLGSFTDEDGKYLAEILDGTPVKKGDTLRALLFGTKSQDFFVEDSDPPDVVLIKPSTAIKIKGVTHERKSVGISYEDIGGLKKEIGKIRERKNSHCQSSG